jgi:transcription antitermination factor NusG
MSSTNSHQKRIKQISQEIAALSKELEDLLIQEATEETEDLKVGTTVRIINNHGGLQGKEGTVIKVSNKQATVQIHNGPIVQRAKRNLSRA